MSIKGRLGITIEKSWRIEKEKLKMGKARNAIFWFFQHLLCPLVFFKTRTRCHRPLLHLPLPWQWRKEEGILCITAEVNDKIPPLIAFSWNGNIGRFIYSSIASPQTPCVRFGASYKLRIVALPTGSFYRAVALCRS